MIYRMSFLPVLFALFFSVRCFSQSSLSAAEVEDFYKLIKQTTEYKGMKRMVDSVNKNPDLVPEEIDFKIVKQEGSAADTYIFQALVSRKILGFRAEEYGFMYDRRKKQIVSVNR